MSAKYRQADKLAKTGFGFICMTAFGQQRLNDIEPTGILLHVFNTE